MSTAADLIERFGMVPHPEGGHYCELHRSTMAVTADDGSGRVRRAYTTIHFLLTGDEFSAWHRLSSDETWLHHEGCDVTIHQLHHDGTVTSHGIGRSAGAYQCTIPAHTWFAAAPVDPASFSFVSCVVGPGFEFADFELATRDQLRREFADRAGIAGWIDRFTRA